eukprot:TRINITY_DN34882_c0_g1_i3.p1 TRINITY_DN34882_c0_g1~~TRINITY_DN34882_c0_g1_i3.p1  ORF type:complete len:190 (-),score=53.58 TRINITY_DN34882_c0_g1_i3:93-662(-)
MQRFTFLLIALVSISGAEAQGGIFDSISSLWNKLTGHATQVTPSHPPITRAEHVAAAIAAKLEKAKQVEAKNVEEAKKIEALHKKAFSRKEAEALLAEEVAEEKKSSSLSAVFSEFASEDEEKQQRIKRHDREIRSSLDVERSHKAPEVTRSAADKDAEDYWGHLADKDSQQERAVREEEYRSDVFLRR